MFLFISATQLAEIGEGFSAGICATAYSRGGRRRRRWHLSTGRFGSAVKAWPRQCLGLLNERVPLPLDLLLFLMDLITQQCLLLVDLFERLKVCGCLHVVNRLIKENGPADALSISCGKYR